MIRRIFAPALTLLLLFGVGAAVYMSAREQWQLQNLETVRGVSGSEKIPFFNDERTRKALAESPHYLQTLVDKAGSRQIATSFNLDQYDFAFPAGIPAAEKIRRERRATKSVQPFFTPMVIASWKPIAEILMANGIVEFRDKAYYIIDMNRLFRLIIEKKRWNELKEASRYPANKSVLVTTTDIRTSNSAAMYLALASYVLNGNAIVQNDAQIADIIEPLAALFMRQGFTENSSAVPFQDYLTMGPGKTPMVMIYEAQFLSEAAKPDSPLSDDMVLLYPEPTLFTKHIYIPLSEAGRRLGEILTTDQTVQQIATEYGLRSDNIGLFRKFVVQKQLSVPDMLVNVIEPPSYEILESMIQQIEQRYNRQGL
ncbi:MAG: hypothetical protein ACU84J_14600 [Gammaproteobacteria bacterium]